MINRGDPARAASPLVSRMGSFADKQQPMAALRRLPGSGTEVLQPQDAWDFTAVQDAEGNLAMQMSRHVSAGRSSDCCPKLLHCDVYRLPRG